MAFGYRACYCHDNLVICARETVVLKRILENKPYTVIRKVVIAIIGVSVLLVGAAMLFLPGPAIIVIPAGLAILATEFSWAKNLLRKLKEKTGWKT